MHLEDSYVEGKKNMTQQLTGKEFWDNTKELLGNYQVVFGSQGSAMIRNNPKKMGGILSRYKFAAKMACKTGSVLELGCGEGLGAMILSENAVYTGVDSNSLAIQTAKQNFPNHNFIHDDFMGKKYGSFKAIVSLYPISAPLFFQTILNNLTSDGVVVLCGTKKEEQEIKSCFYQVFTFGISDEIVHTGPSDDLIYVGCHARK